MENLLNLEQKLRKMQDEIEGLTLGQEVAEEQAEFWEKKAKGLEKDLKLVNKKLEQFDSMEQQLRMYKSKVGELAQ